MAANTSSRSSLGSVAYINARVYTVNEKQPWAEAFVVSPEGNFLAIGSTTDILAEATSMDLVTYDLRGNFVMPGIHDAHAHMLLSGIAANSHVHLPPQLKSEALVEELKKGSCLCKYAHTQQDWLNGDCYTIENFDRQTLDSEYPSTPVAIHAGAGHSVYLNSEAMRRAGYNIDNEQDGQATWYARDADGRLTGEMAENGMSKVMTMMPKPNLAYVKRTLKEAQRRLHKAGVTSCQEASANTLMLQGLRELEASNDLKLDLQTHIVYAPDWIGREVSDSLHKTLEEADRYKSKHVDTRFVKIILDGVPLAPYYSHAGLKDDGQVDESKLFILNVKEAVQKYDQRGMTMKIHCTGHGATRVALDAYEQARQINPDGPRHEIAHCSGVHDDEYPRFKALNVTAEMSPAFFFSHPVTEASRGLMDWNFPKMRRADAHVTIGSDWGAGADPDIIPCVANVVESVGDGDRKIGGQRLCRMMTLAGAQAVGREGDLGSIEVGKKANFIAVDKNLADGEFDGAQVVGTWFEGEIVWEKDM